MEAPDLLMDDFMVRMTARIAQLQREEEEKKLNPPESKECFCYICGGPSTPNSLLKKSELDSGEYDGDNDVGNVEQFYNDYCDCYTPRAGPIENHAGSCRSRKGYEKRKISHRNLKWLGNVRMISHFLDNNSLATETDVLDHESIEGIELLTQMGSVHYGHNFGNDTWTFPMSDNLLGKPLGCLIHDACLQILIDAHQAEFGDGRPLNLREALLALEVSARDRDSPEFDWGYGDTFGEAHRLDDQNGNPVENSEWTVIDPQSPVSLQPFISEALQTPRGAFSFRFEKSCSRNGADGLSSLPSELRMQVLEMLPINSVLNLFLASSSFREMASNLPQRFWRSRIFTDFPWWWESSREFPSSNDHGSFPFDRLFYIMQEASKENTILKNRHRIWKNGERVIKDIEARHEYIRQEVGNRSLKLSSFSKVSRRLIAYKAIAISRDFKEMPHAASAIEIAGDEKDSNQLTELTAYFGATEQVIGLEFRLMKESHGRLLGNRSALASKVAIQPGCLLTAIVVSFGSPEINVKERRIRGLGICTSNSPAKPVHILGQLNDEDVIQVIGVEPRMAIVGLAAEFNAETFTTFGTFLANCSLAPITSEYSGLDLTLHTQWLCRHPPLEWPLNQYILQNPSNSVGGRFTGDIRNARPRVLDPSIYFVNLRGRQLSQLKAIGNFAAVQPAQGHLTGLAFFFGDGSVDDIGRNINRDDASDAQSINFQVGQDEAITDMLLYTAVGSRQDENSSYKLCGLQVMTTLKRKLSLGCVETSEFVRGDQWHSIPGLGVCGIQVGFRNGAVECAGLAFWKP